MNFAYQKQNNRFLCFDRNYESVYQFPSEAMCPTGKRRFFYQFTFPHAIYLLLLATSVCSHQEVLLEDPSIKDKLSALGDVTDQENLDTILKPSFNLYFIKEPKDVDRAIRLDGAIQSVDPFLQMKNSDSHISPLAKDGVMNYKPRSVVSPLSKVIKEANTETKPMDILLDSDTNGQFLIPQVMELSNDDSSVKSSKQDNKLISENSQDNQDVLNNLEYNPEPRITINANQEKEIRNRLRRKHKNNHLRWNDARDRIGIGHVERNLDNLKIPRSKKLVTIKKHDSEGQRKSPALMKHTDSTSHVTSASVPDIFIYVAVMLASVLSCILFIIIGFILGSIFTNSNKEEELKELSSPAANAFITDKSANIPENKHQRIVGTRSTPTLSYSDSQKMRMFRQDIEDLRIKRNAELELETTSPSVPDSVEVRKSLFGSPSDISMVSPKGNDSEQHTTSSSEETIVEDLIFPDKWLEESLKSALPRLHYFNSTSSIKSLEK